MRRFSIIGNRSLGRGIQKNNQNQKFNKKSHKNQKKPTQKGYTSYLIKDYKSQEMQHLKEELLALNLIEQ